MERVEGSKGGLWGVRTVPQTFVMWTVLFLWIKVGSLLQIFLNCYSLALCDWATAQTWSLDLHSISSSSSPWDCSGLVAF